MLAVLAAAISAATLSVAYAPPASADDSRCPPKSFCLFLNSNFGGEGAVFSAPGTGNTPPVPYARDCDLRQDRYPSGRIVDDSASSMINNTTHYVTLYRNLGCGGDTYVAKPRSEDSTFSNNTVVNGNFNDKASGLVFH